MVNHYNGIIVGMVYNAMMVSNDHISIVGDRHPRAPSLAIDHVLTNGYQPLITHY